MPRYRRSLISGGTYFFTVVTYHRRPILTTNLGRGALRDAIDAVRLRRPFKIDAFVLMPDHLHAIWTLPPGDSDYSIRWRRIKEMFTRTWLAVGGHDAEVSPSKQCEGRRGVWQPRFWEHVIRDADDFAAHMDYIHYNPVKHGLTRCPHEWPYSSFYRCVEEKRYRNDWMCRCAGRRVEVLDFEGVSVSTGE